MSIEEWENQLTRDLREYINYLITEEMLFDNYQEFLNSKNSKMTDSYLNGFTQLLTAYSEVPQTKENKIVIARHLSAYLNLTKATETLIHQEPGVDLENTKEKFSTAIIDFQTATDNLPNTAEFTNVRKAAMLASAAILGFVIAAALISLTGPGSLALLGITGALHASNVAILPLIASSMFVGFTGTASGSLAYEITERKVLNVNKNEVETSMQLQKSSEDISSELKTKTSKFFTKNISTNSHSQKEPTEDHKHTKN